jgi:methylated-DNA-[protein]-cysteine S-methyltransferase
MASPAFGIFETVFGPAFAEVDATGALVLLSFAPDREAGRAELRGVPRRDAAVAAVAEQIAEYGRGERAAFDLPLAAAGDAFQSAVWAELRAIPMGETRSYGQVAAAVGEPGAARAVGQACGANPVMLVVPCHRVIGADGRLTGFGGGLPLKARMLDFERRLAGPQRELF